MIDLPAVLRRYFSADEVIPERPLRTASMQTEDFVLNTESPSTYSPKGFLVETCRVDGISRNPVGRHIRLEIAVWAPISDQMPGSGTCVIGNRYRITTILRVWMKSPAVNL